MINLKFKKRRGREEKVTEDELISLVDEAHETGVIETHEAEMIQNIMEFGDTDAREIMTHRNDIVAFDGNMTLSEVSRSILSESNSRFPVYEGTIDSILGIVTFRDIMKQTILHPENNTIAIQDIPQLIREASIFPETRSIESILQYMRSSKIQMAVIVDEYGQTSGILTMEDIIEEIVGNILDEYDTEDQFILHAFDNSIVMDGLTPLWRAGEVLQVSFEDEDFETLSGYLTSLLGHIPESSDKEVKGKGYLFHILKVEKHIIRKVRAERLPAEKR